MGPAAPVGLVAVGAAIVLDTETLVAISSRGYVVPEMTVPSAAIPLLIAASILADALTGQASDVIVIILVALANPVCLAPVPKAEPDIDAKPDLETMPDPETAPDPEGLIPITVPLNV